MASFVKRSKSYTSVFKQISDRLTAKPEVEHCGVTRAGFGINLSTDANSKHGKPTKNQKFNLIVKQPKRPAGAYACYMQKVYPTYHANHPGQTVFEIGREISKAWKSLDSEEKQEFVNQANLNKEKYLEAQKLFNSELTEDEKEELKEQARLKQQGRQRRKLKAERKSLEMPSKPRNAYSFFVESMKRDNDEDVIAFARRCGERWRSMNESDKKTFNELSAKDNDRYSRDISGWEMKMLQSGHLNVIRSKSRASTLSAMKKELSEGKDHLDKSKKMKTQKQGPKKPN